MTVNVGDLPMADIAAWLEINPPALPYNSLVSVPSTVGAAGDPAVTLPSSPVNDQQAILTDSLTAPTYEWLLQWVASISKWIHIGGGPAYSSVDTSQNGGGATNTFVDFPTVGPQFTVPRAGIYLVRFGCTGGGNGGATTSFAGVKAGSTSPSLGTDRTSIAVSWQSSGGLASEFETGTLAAADVVKMMMADGNTGRPIAMSSRWLSVLPVTLT